MKLRNATLKDFPKGELVVLKEDLIVYKKVYGAIVELIIPKGAKAVRASLYNCQNKIRSDVAIVTAIYPYLKYSNYYKSLENVTRGFINLMGSHLGHVGLVYKIGKVVKPFKKFDSDVLDACRSGIHFFATRKEAENYR